MTDFAIIADGVHKRYRRVRALNGLDLRVPSGAVYGLLGPNGSGKTTAVRVLTTLLRCDTGRAVVAGFDVATSADRVRERIAVTGTADRVPRKRPATARTGRANPAGDPAALRFPRAPC